MVERPQMVKVILAGQPTSFQVNQPGRRQRSLHLGQLPRIGDPQQIAQNPAGRVKVRIRARRLAHFR
jgi:hypothetical protein